MGQQLLDKFNKYRLVNGGSFMPSGDKQHPVSVKKAALRELPNESANITTKPSGNSLLPKDTGPALDSGTKRHQPDCPSTSPLKSGVNGHLVYVRRKLDTEQAGSPCSRKFGNDSPKEPKVQPVHSREPTSACFPELVRNQVSSATAASGELPLPHSHEKPISGLSALEPNDSMAASASADARRLSNKYWTERYLRLTMFLDNCDQSNQEDYKHMLRSISPAARSKHAYDLEARTLQLLVEEAKEMERVKELNVLGKALPQHHALISMEIPSPLRAQLQRTEKTADTSKLHV